MLDKDWKKLHRKALSCHSLCVGLIMMAYFVLFSVYVCIFCGSFPSAVWKSPMPHLEVFVNVERWHVDFEPIAILLGCGWSRDVLYSFPISSEISRMAKIFFLFGWDELMDPSHPNVRSSISGMYYSVSVTGIGTLKGVPFMLPSMLATCSDTSCNAGWSVDLIP